MIRNTVQRTTVLETVRGLTDHPTADEVYAAVSAQCRSISRATVYRLLGNLSEEGLIRRVEIANAPDVFDFTLEEHAHFRCDVCGRVFDFPTEHIQHGSNPMGFEVRKVEITVSGTCASCKQKSGRTVG